MKFLIGLIMRYCHKASITGILGAFVTSFCLSLALNLLVKTNSGVI